MTTKTYRLEDGKYEIDRNAITGMMRGVRRNGKTMPDLLEGLESNDLAHAMLNRIDDLGVRLAEVHSWIVCAAIASPEDMMQNAAHIMDLAAPDEFRSATPVPPGAVNPAARLMLEASTGMHGPIAQQLAAEWSRMAELAAATREANPQMQAYVDRGSPSEAEMRDAWLAAGGTMHANGHMEKRALWAFLRNVRAGKVF